MSATAATRRRLAGLVDVGEDRQAGARLDLVERTRGPRRARGRETNVTEVRLALSNDALKTIGTPHARGDLVQCAIAVSSACACALDHARAER